MQGIFDGIKKSMEAGYTGGENSMYAKQKEVDARKRKEQQKKSAARKSKGFKELKDVKQKTFSKITYVEVEEDPEEKKFFGYGTKKNTLRKRFSINFWSLRSIIGPCK